MTEATPVIQTDLEGLSLLNRGKVRDLYQLDDALLIVTTDRVSAFDRVLGTLPLKGQVLQWVSRFWFEHTAELDLVEIERRGDRLQSVTEQMEPERLFVFSWPPGTLDPDTEYGDDAKVVVEFRLEPRDNGTRLTIIETGFLQFPESKRLEVLRSNQQGWEMQAENIAAYVAG